MSADLAALHRLWRVRVPARNEVSPRDRDTYVGACGDRLPKGNGVSTCVDIATTNELFGRLIRHDNLSTIAESRKRESRNGLTQPAADRDGVPRDEAETVLISGELSRDLAERHDPTVSDGSRSWRKGFQG